MSILKALDAPQPAAAIPNPHQDELERARAQVKQELASDDGYKSMGESRGVQFSKKYDPKSSEGLAIVKGSCVVKGVTTDAFAPCTQLVGFRRRWDPQYLDGRILQRLSTHTYTFHASAKGFAGIVDPRDFTGIAEVQGSGMRNQEILIVQTSTDTGAPLQRGTVRGGIVFSGWHFLPQGDDVKITHVLKIALNGNIPASIVRALSSSLPQVVGAARDVFYKVGHPPYAQFDNGQSDTTAVFQAEGISAEDDLEFYFTFTTTAGGSFEIVYDHKHMYKSGIILLIEGVGADVADDGAGQLSVACTRDLETVTIRIRPRIY